MEGKGNFWYAVRVRSRFESTVATHLRARGYELFLPLYKSRRRWFDRYKEIKFPLFPGYVFCQMNPLNRLPVLSIPGVVHLVGVGKTPAPIDEGEIGAIQIAVESGLATRPWAFLQVGRRVKVERGPLCGVEGIIVGVRGLQRLVLSISLLQRSVAVEVQGDWVVPLAQQALPYINESSSQPFVPERRA